MRMIVAALFCWLLPLVPSLYADHNRLIPRPQQIRYGEARLALKGVTISFGSSALAEDLFAADELASALADLTGARVPVMSGRAAAPSIVLYRTGGVDPLPGADERPGPDSRESYEVHISPAGAEIRARSSASLYYAAQTIRQLVEGRVGDRFL